MECPYCRAKNRDRARFCRLCAQRIDGENSGPADSPENDDARERMAVLASPRNMGVAAGLLLIIAVSGFLLFGEEPAGGSESRSIKTGGAGSRVDHAPMRENLSLSRSAMIAEVAYGGDGPPYGRAADTVLPVNKGEVPRVEKKARSEPMSPTKSKTVENATSGQNPRITDRSNGMVKREPVVEPSIRLAQAGPAPIAIGKATLAAEMETCEGKSFFAKGVCQNRVRWNYCQNQWGQNPDCPALNAQESGG